MIPYLVQHMTIAIYEKAGLPGGPLDRFEGALRVAVSQCVRFGLVGPGSDPEALTLTTKGSQNESVHRRKGDHDPKARLFRVLYEASRARRAEALKNTAAGEPQDAPSSTASRSSALVDRIRRAEEGLPTRDD